MTPSLDQTVIDQSLSDDDEIFEEALEVQDCEEDCEELGGEVASLAREELGETEVVVRENVREMRSWLQTQPHLAQCRTDRNFLARFLRTNKHNREKSCKMLERYLKMRTAHPKWFQNLDIEDPMVSELIESGYIFVLPEPDPQGRKVLFSVARKLDPERHNTSHVVRAHIATFESLLQDEENQVRGFTYIFDCTGLTLSHLSIWTPQEVTKVLSICEKNLPMRHKDINLLNLPFPMWAVFEFCKTLLSDKIRRRFSVISSFEKLSLKFPGDLLPSEYGGAGSLEEMAASWASVVAEHRQSLLELDNMVIEESAMKRTKEKKHSLWGLFSGYNSTES